MNKILALLKNKTIAILAAVMVANIAVIGYLGYQTYVVNKPVLAIDFKPLTEREIKEWYEMSFESTEGLNIKFEYDEKIDEGKLISQSVKEGEAIDPETGLDLVISNGRDPNKEIVLPKFVEEKYTKDKIDKFFVDNYFTDVNYEYETSEEEKDTVIRVNVEGKAKRSQLILVTLSAGENEEEIEVEVPNFKQYTVSNARAWGQSNSVTIRINYVFSDDFAEGKILSQSIAAGQKVNVGSRITLQVSLGRGIKIKDLSSLSKEEAIKWLSDNQLKHKLIYDYNDKIEKGKIIYSDPKPGSIVAEGEVIALHVSNGKDPDLIEIKVESKRGVSEAEFKKYIEELGLTSRKNGSNYDNEIAKGLVISNDTGNFKKSNPVGYTLSLGPYVLKAENFENKKLNDANSLVSRENALNAGISLKTNAVFDDTHAKDVLFGCSVSGKTVTCNLSKGAMSTVKNFVGQIKTESFSDGGITYNVIFDDSFTDGSKYGEVYKQSHNGGDKVAPGISVDLYVRRGEEKKAYIELNPDAYNGSTLEETVNKVQSALGQFNLNITYAKHESLGVGKIISITVNDGAIKTSGDYPLSTKVEVKICDGRMEN